MVDGKENHKFDVGVKRLIGLVGFVLSFRPSFYLCMKAMCCHVQWL